MAFRRGGRSSDRDEFAELFAAQFEGVVRSLVIVVGDRETARDIAQDAFVKGLLRWHRIRAYDEPAAWVRKVAFRAALRHKKRAAHYEALVRSQTASETTYDRSAFVGAEVVAALAGLAPMQRAAIALHYLDDLSVREVGDVLGCAESTVRVHLHRGRQQLALVLGEEQGHVR